jgi:hypothetical protein
MADTKRKRFVSTKIENGVATFNLFGPPNDHGEQTVDRTVTFNPAVVADAIRDNVICQGFATIFANAYQSMSDVDPAEAEKLFKAFSTPSKKAHGHRADPTTPANLTTSSSPWPKPPAAPSMSFRTTLTSAFRKTPRATRSATRKAARGNSSRKPCSPSSRKIRASRPSWPVSRKNVPTRWPQPPRVRSATRRQLSTRCSPTGNRATPAVAAQ